MIGLIITDTERMLNGLERMKEFNIHPSYTNIQLLHQLIGRAKSIVEWQLEINNLQKEEVKDEIANATD